MNNSIGERLKIVRNGLGIRTQSQFAEKMGINQTTLSKYENGTSDFPDELKVKISRFGINLHWLLTGEGGMFLSEPQKIPTKPEKHPLLEDLEALIAENLKDIKSRLSEIEAVLNTEERPDYVDEPEAEFGIWFVESVAAGPPIDQMPDSAGSIKVPARFISTTPDDYYAAVVRGESMTQAGIPDGVIILIRKADTPKNGAIQVIQCLGKSTLKRLKEIENGGWRLCYEDGTGRYIEIAPGEEYTVQGDFVAVLPGKC